MTVVAAFCPLSLQTLFDSNVNPISGGHVYFFDAGTTNARTVYQDPGLTEPYSTPVLTDAFGRIPPIYVGPNAYKVVLRDASDSLISQADQLPGATQTSDSSSSSTNGWATGDLKAAYNNATQDGWLICNAKTIGNASSSATARANADVQNLFTLLWNIDANLTVSGGRGASATADFSAAKTITLPDFRGLTLVGCDGMGNTVAGNITSASTATPDAIGTKFGAETAGLTVSQLPTFTPTVTIGAAGGHTPAGTMDSQGGHDHTGTSDTNGSHQHPLESCAVTVTTGASGRGIAAGGTTDISTDTNGVHAHTFTTASVGGHTHNITMNAVGDHTHTATAAAIGSGQNHANAQPSRLVYVLVKI